MTPTVLGVHRLDVQSAGHLSCEQASTVKEIVFLAFPTKRRILHYDTTEESRQFTRSVLAAVMRRRFVEMLDFAAWIGYIISLQHS